nr:hypothetical protein [Tanacetum cinerariifolium]
MTDSRHSIVSHTLISSPERSWDIPDVDPYEEAALQAIEQVAPPLSPAYLPNSIELDEHVPVYVSEPKYLEYLEPPADDIVVQDQPHADDVVHTALSSGYIADFDLEEEPEEDPEEEEHADYANELDEEDPEEEDPKEEDPEEEEFDANTVSEEEPSEGSEDTEPSEVDETFVTPPPSRLRGVRIYVHPQTPMPPLSEARVDELLAMPTSPPSLLTPMSSSLPHIPSPPLPVPSPPHMPSSPLPSPVPVETHTPEQDVAAALLTLPFATRRSEESSAAAARPPKDLYGFVDTTKAEASITRRHARTLHDIDHKMMTAVELVNLRVSYEVQTRQRDGEEFHSQLRDAQCDCAVKFATYTMLDAALTWWNGHIKTIGHDDGYAMTWETLKKKMTDKYYPRGEIKKLEIKLWNLKVEKYIGGLPDNIHGNVMSARPKNLDETIELANDLMDQKLHTYAEKKTENKRRADDAL